MNRLRFTKMHGLGNDFIVLDGVNQEVLLTSQEIQSLSTRQTGIGFDQCLIVEPSQNPDIDFFYRIYNANGEPVGQCGNGARCIARFIEYYQLSPKKHLKVATTTTTLALTINSDDTVTVAMGQPHFEPQDIPLLTEKKCEIYRLNVLGQEIQCHALSVGNPHAILLVDDLNQAPVTTLGPAICQHPVFPEQVNVSFLHILSPEHVELRVFERGAGETLACGSAAVAAVAAGQHYHHLRKSVRVDLPGGSLCVNTDNTGGLFLTGPATFSYEGILFDPH
jgi:diaminopimelate epimerase